MTITPNEQAAMARAIELSIKGAAGVLPNPVVGCVVLDAAGEVAGEGWHARAGGPHAEVIAMTEAGKRARGGTAVVTLEPCDHTGRTGPCSRALLAAGVRRVVFSVADPSPVASGGAQTLRDNGIDVVDGLMAEAAERANQVWLTSVRRGRPFVTWKFAATLDGRSAAQDGSSRWITGEAARADVHRLRSEVDAVLVGVGTVLADDPQLTVRGTHQSTEARRPLRVVADTHGRTPSTARVRDDEAPSVVLTAADVAVGPDGRLLPAELLAALQARGLRHVLLEGGPLLAGSFLAAGLVDRVVAYLAPALLGAGPAALASAGVETIDEAFRLDVDDVTVLNQDVRITGRPRSPR